MDEDVPFVTREEQKNKSPLQQVAWGCLCQKRTNQNSGFKQGDTWAFETQGACFWPENGNYQNVMSPCCVLLGVLQMGPAHLDGETLCSPTEIPQKHGLTALWEMRFTERNLRRTKAKGVQVPNKAAFVEFLKKKQHVCDGSLTRPIHLIKPQTRPGLLPAPTIPSLFPVSAYCIFGAKVVRTWEREQCAFSQKINRCAI